MMKHYLLTRYNCGLYSGVGFVDKNGNSINCYADKWMEHRFNLFSKVCLPSIKNQTNQSFDWIVVLDKKTPKHFKEQLEACKTIRKFKILYDKEEARTVPLSYIKNDIKDENCITSRVDNDDALHKRFMEIVAQEAEDNMGNAILFANGCYYDVSQKTMSLHSYPLNPFMSLPNNPSRDKSIVWSVDHGSIGDISKGVFTIHCQPMWLSTVHLYNRKNTLRGKMVEMQSEIENYLKNFSINMELEII